MMAITRVPQSPPFIEGVINLRGKVIPVIDMGKRFGLEKVATDKNNRIVVVNVADMILGIIVDAVTEVIRIPTDAIEPVSDIITAAKSDYLLGIAKIGDKMVILLEIGKLLSGDSLLANLAAPKTAEKVPAGVK